MAKPFSTKELVARVRAVLRRARGPLARGRRRRPACTSTATSRSTSPPARPAAAATVVRSPPASSSCWRSSCATRGQAFRREEILESVWGYRYGDTSTVTVHVRRLREKIEADPANPARIATVWGVGYRWEGDGPAVAR